MLAKFKNQDFLGNSYFFLILFFGILIIHQIIFQQFFPNSRGLLGHDYEQFIPNLMFGKIWFYNNFLSVPWFTPSFCCGIPFYADPQSMYYSIPQIIFLIFNPILSVKIIFFILSFISYVGMFLLVRGNFKCNSYVSLLCASLFLFNGFFVYRAIAGHVDYLSYIFVPLYCYFLIKSYENQSNNSSYVYLILSSIIFANFFHSGSGPIILIIFTSILSVLLFYSHLINSFKIFFKFTLSLFLGISISLSKITAALFFLNNFPRKYPATEFHSFISFIKTSKSFRTIVREYHKVEMPKNAYGKLFIKGFLLNFINIGVLLGWLGFIVIGTSITKSENGVTVFIVTMLVSYFVCDLFKIAAAKRLKNKLTPRRIFKTKKIVALVILGFGILLLSQGLFPELYEKGKEQIEKVNPLD